APSRLLRAESWQAGRGHAVSFAGLLMFTVVLYFRPQDYYPALASAHIALVVASLTLAAFIPSQLAAEGTLTARPREVNLALLLCAAVALSVPLAIDRALALDAFWESCAKSVITFIFIVNIVRTERRLKLMLYLALAITLLLCLMALNDYRLGNLTVEGYRVQGKSTGGMFENTNDLAIHLVTMLPLAVGLGLAGRGLVRKLLFGACAAMILATVVITFSRGAFLALLASGVFMAWKFGRRRRAVVFGALAATAAVFLALAPGEYWVRVASIFDSSLDRYGSSTARTALLMRSVVATLANPFLGVGIGNFVLTSPRAQVTHNAYTQVSAEAGVVASIIYTMFIVAPLKRLRLIEQETRAERRPTQFYYLAVGLQASLVAYMVSSFFASVAFYLYIYYLVGYAVCLRRLYLAAGERKGAAGAGVAGPAEAGAV
ncbi:MAG TPA: O-antigen ligase family protein, partial [Pyrinomonadaceae bacterium]